MKRILLILLVPFLSYSQAKIDDATNVIYLKEVRQVEGSSEELKKKASEWIAKSYNNSNYVTRLDESDNIIVKGGFDVGADYTNYGVTIFSKRDIDYTLDLAFREGRYKIEINNLLLDGAVAGDALAIYLMSKEQYRSYLRIFYEEYDGPGAKAGKKRVENDKKFAKDYEAIHNYGLKIVPQILQHLNSIDRRLLEYMNSSEDDDW